MNNQEILEKAIKKVIANGWSSEHDFNIPFHHLKYPSKDYLGFDEFDNETLRWYRRGQFDETDSLLSLSEVIFNHDFAKALWGDEKCYYPMANTELGTMWQYHLQAMVIADNPIKYLGDNMDNETQIEETKKEEHIHDSFCLNYGKCSE